jgi:hypothetical protein
MYVICFTNQGPAIQFVVSKGKSVNDKFNKGKVLHKLKKYFKNYRPATGLCAKLSGCCLRISETGKGCRASSPFLFARSCPLILFPVSQAQKTPS